MTINNNSGEIDDTTLMRTLSKRDALARVERIYGQASAQSIYDSAQASGDTELVDAIKARADSFGWVLTPGGTGTEAGQAKKLLTNLLNVALLAPGPVGAAEKFNDPRFTATGLGQERSARIAAAVNDVAAQASGIVAKIQTLDAKATQKADAARPVFNPNDANALLRSAQAWEFTVKPVLDRDGFTNWPQLLDALDLDGLFAIQRFVPGWVNTQPLTANLTSGLDQILDGAEQRIPAASNDQTAAALANNAAQTNEYLNQAQAIANSVSNMKNSNDALSLKGLVQRVSVYAGIQNDIVWPGTDGF